MALEVTLACPRSFRKGHPRSSFTSPPPRLLVGRKQHTAGSTLALPSTRSSTVYRRFKRRLGRTLRALHCKRRLVSHRKSPPHQFFGVEGSPSGPNEFRASMQGPDCSCCKGQHNGSLLCKQTGQYEVRVSLCPPMETSVLVPPQGNNPEGTAHSRSLECDSGQTFLTQSGDSNRVVPISASVQSFVFHMGPTANRLVCNPVQSQTASVYVTGAGSGSLGSRCSQHTMGEFGHVRLSTSIPDSPGDHQNDGSGLSQDDSTD